MIGADRSISFERIRTSSSALSISSKAKSLILTCYIALPSTFYFPSKAHEQYHPEIVGSITPVFIVQLLRETRKLVVPYSYSPVPHPPEIGHIVGISGTILKSYFEQLFSSGYSEHTVPDSLDQIFTIHVESPACKFKTINPDQGNADKIMTAVRLTVTLKSFSITGGGPE